MTPREYLDAVKARLIADPIVQHFSLRKERWTVQDGFLRARLTLVDGSMLEFGEYVQVTERGNIEVVTYSYHWADDNGALRKRWDNTPHFPNLEGFPHHLHDGATGLVRPSHPMSIFRVLDILAREID